MDQELKDFLLAMESRLDSKLTDVETRLIVHMGSLETRVMAHMGSLETRVMTHTETVETRLLSGFWKWARTSDIKARQHGLGISSLDERLAVVEERLRDIELRRPS